MSTVAVLLVSDNAIVVGGGGGGSNSDGIMADTTPPVAEVELPATEATFDAMIDAAPVESSPSTTTAVPTCAELYAMLPRGLRMPRLRPDMSAEERAHALHAWLAQRTDIDEQTKAYIAMLRTRAYDVPTSDSSDDRDDATKRLKD